MIICVLGPQGVLPGQRMIQSRVDCVHGLIDSRDPVVTLLNTGVLEAFPVHYKSCQCFEHTGE